MWCSIASSSPTTSSSSTTTSSSLSSISGDTCVSFGSSCFVFTPSSTHFFDGSLWAWASFCSLPILPFASTSVYNRASTADLVIVTLLGRSSKCSDCNNTTLLSFSTSKFMDALFLFLYTRGVYMGSLRTCNLRTCNETTTKRQEMFVCV